MQFYDTEKDIIQNIKWGSQRLLKIITIVFLYPIYVFGFWTNHDFRWYLQRNKKDLIRYIGIHLLGLLTYMLTILLIIKL